MTDERSLERAARSWVERGPTQAPEAAVRQALLLIETTTQERDLRIPWRTSPMNRIALAGAAVATLVALVIGGSVGLGWLPNVAPTGTTGSPGTPSPSQSSETAIPTEVPVSPRFTPAGTLNGPRSEHFAVLLPDGTVLVGSGVDPVRLASGFGWNTTERWFPHRNAFDDSAPLGTTTDVAYGGMARVNQSAFVLPDGRVVIVPAGCFCSPQPQLHAELWSETAGVARVRTSDSFITSRTGHSATVLADGTILIAGGATDVAETGSAGSTEIWDPVAETVTPTAAMRFDRMNHAATLLADGRVLMVGGVPTGPGPGDRQYVGQAEIWDPATGTFVEVLSLQGIEGEVSSVFNFRTQSGLRLVTLPDGRVLILDGVTARTWSPTSNLLENAGAFIQPRFGYAAALLPTGEVLVVGGQVGQASDQILASAELWDPVSASFVAAGSLETARMAPTATALADGRVLVVGGMAKVGDLQPDDAELWEPGNAP